jgi:hypothetical protein
MPSAEVVSVRFDWAELELIAEEALDSGVTVPEFVRDAALSRSVSRIAERTEAGDHSEELAAIASRYAALRSGPRFKHLI